LDGELFNAFDSVTGIKWPHLCCAFDHLLLKFFELSGSTMVTAWPALPCRYCADQKSRDGNGNQWFAQDRLVVHLVETVSPSLTVTQVVSYFGGGGGGGLQASVHQPAITGIGMAIDVVNKTATTAAII
jgi:hypothetical protein